MTGLARGRAAAIRVEEFIVGSPTMGCRGCHRENEKLTSVIIGGFGGLMFELCERCRLSLIRKLVQ